MARPIINKILEFDAIKNNTISFSYAGPMPYGNRMVIYNAFTMSIVYDQTQIGTGLTHTVPRDVLHNGTKYAAEISLFDKAGNYSSISEKAYFYALATPDFYFDGFKNSTINDVNSASFYAPLVYTQANFEDLVQFQFFIYDDGKQLLLASEIFHDTQFMTYQYKGLENDKIYYIRAVGLTEHEIPLDTGYIQIYLSYKSHSDYSLVYADCNDYTSVVTYHTRFIVIYPSQEDDYEYDDSIIDLSNKKIVYDQNFLINGDFTITIRGINMWREGTILECENNRDRFYLSSYIYDDGTLRYRLTVPNGISNYIIYSDPIIFSNYDMITIHIRRIGDIYQLVVFVENYSNKKNYWFGINRPTNYNALSIHDVWITTSNSPTVLATSSAIQIDYTNNQPVKVGDYENIWLADINS